MVRALNRERSIEKSNSFNIKKMFDVPGRQAPSLVFENGSDGEADNVQVQRRGRDRIQDSKHISRNDDNGEAKTGHPSDLDLMKEKFSKLLLGEDMSGGGKGVSSALALSNAITNLAASVFGEQKKLEPMAADRRSRWIKEIDWLVSVTDYIVEFVPSQQSRDGINMEVMVTKQRGDLLMNIPALRKLDAILVDTLDQFGNQTEFWYVSRDKEDTDQTTSTPPRTDEKWWKPVVKVPPQGLSDDTRRWLQSQKDSVNQVLKAAMAINAMVLSEMAVPEDYIESLPKNGRSSLGDSIYKSITEDHFDPHQFLSSMDLSSEHKVVDLKNRIEASIVIWQKKMHQKDGKSSWGSAIKLDKRELFEDRVETILLLIKQRFPGIAQSVLDISKIEFTKDVGHAILESYSRIIESLAFAILSKIEDVLFADAAAANTNEFCNDKPPEEETGERLSSAMSTTLSDIMGWGMNQDADGMKKNGSIENLENYVKSERDKIFFMKPISVIPKKFSYLEKLENLSGMRSPAARH